MTIGKGKAGSPQAVLAPCNNNSGAFSPPSSAPPAPVPSMEARGAGQAGIAAAGRGKRERQQRSKNKPRSWRKKRHDA